MLSSSIGIKESIKEAKNPDYGQLRAGSVEESQIKKNTKNGH